MNIIPKPLEAEELDGLYEFKGELLINSEIDGAEEIIKRFIPGGKFSVKADSSVKKEGYRLEVQPDGVTVSAFDEKGVFYAVMSLLELSGLAEGKNRAFCCVKIKDEPRFSHRGFMLDEARHFFGKDFVKKTLDMLALMKLNIFHWHLTDDQGWRVEIKKYPLLTEKGSIRKSTQLDLVGYDEHKEKHENKPYGKGYFYTQEDIKEIVSYAASLNIEVIPEIDMPGHLTAAAACYPELTCTGEELEVADRWGIMETIGCAGSDFLYQFVFDVIDELVPLFPGRYFHIGGDEVPKKRWKECPKCQAKIKELGLKDEEELQGAFNLKVQEHLKTKGKSLIGWNEILNNGNVSSDTIVQWWVGDCEETGVKAWVEKGNKIIMTSCPYVYMDYFYSSRDLRKFYSMDYDTVGLPEEFEDNIIGCEAPMWTEYARTVGKFNFNVYPRMQALSEICWTARKNKDFDDFNSRLHNFGGIFEKFGIVPASEKYYLCPDGDPRIAEIDKEWKENPNTEYERFLRENK